MDIKIKMRAFMALIPARGGSKGVPHKNIKLLNGFPLIAYTIGICHMSGMIDRIVVSTDDEEIAEIARQYGAEVPFIRPSELALDNSGDYEFVNHAINWFLKNEGEIPEFLVHMRPTTPIRDAEMVDCALKQFQEAGEYTSLRSAHEAPESPYKWFVRGEKETFCSITHGMDNEAINADRKTFPIVYIPDGYVDIIRSEYVIQNHRLHGEKMMGFESPICVEVDTQEEFDYLEYQMRKEEPKVYKYLMNQKIMGGFGDGV